MVVMAGSNEKVKNCLSAKEARQLTENSNKTLNIVFKLIKEEAEHGKESLIFDVYGLDKSAISRITDALKKEGYTVLKREEKRNGKREPVVVDLLIRW